MCSVPKRNKRFYHLYFWLVYCGDRSCSQQCLEERSWYHLVTHKVGSWEARITEFARAWANERVLGDDSGVPKNFQLQIVAMLANPRRASDMYWMIQYIFILMNKQYFLLAVIIDLAKILMFCS